jgi:ligand-binding SRPBCC domain-containing protein
MPLIHLETFINASAERCFDLSLNVDVHGDSVAHTHERAVAGVTSGVMRLGDTVTWEAVHFGIKQRLTTQITEYVRPTHFVDEMLHGAFSEMKHEHDFSLQPGGTLMIDRFWFRSPLGLLGWLADTLVLTRYMKRLLLSRNSFIKRMAEGSNMLTDSINSQVI